MNKEISHAMGSIHLLSSVRARQHTAPSHTVLTALVIPNQPPFISAHKDRPKTELKQTRGSRWQKLESSPLSDTIHINTTIIEGK